MNVSIRAQSTYIYRVQSSAWRLSNYWPSTPSPHSECFLPQHHQRRGGGGGGTHSPGGDGVGGSIFRKTPDIGLASYSSWRGITLPNCAVLTPGVFVNIFSAVNAMQQELLHRMNWNIRDSIYHRPKQGEVACTYQILKVLIDLKLYRYLYCLVSQITAALEGADQQDNCFVFSSKQHQLYHEAKNSLILNFLKKIDVIEVFGYRSICQR